MKVYVMSVFVDEQDRALRFYTEVLGFVTKAEIPMGEHRWLTVVAAEDPDGVEVSLEPSDHPAVGLFREALTADGIPWTSFAVDDVPAAVAGCRRPGSSSPRSPYRWGRSPRRYSMTPAET